MLEAITMGAPPPNPRSGLFGTVPAEVLAAIEVVVGSHRTLEDVVRWGLALSPPRLIERVVVQDEYTHDVAIAWNGGVYLVYDTT